MARLAHLVDTSVLARLSQPSVLEAFAPLVAANEVALCPPVAFEVLYSARSAADYEQVAERLDAFPFLDVTDADHQRAIYVQRRLAARGQHRAISLVDALVAAIAERRSVTVLHYDRDFELIASVTQQPQAWIVPAGAAD